MLTLADIQTSRFQTASGYPTGSTAFLEVTNDAVAELCRRGDFSGTLLPIQVCVSAGCVTWPRYVKDVRKMYSRRHGTIEMRNEWYRFLDEPGWRRHWEGGCGGGWGNWRDHERNMEKQYRAPTYQDICGTGNTLQFFVDVQQDVGASMTIFGQDDNGQDLKTQNGDGTWSLGLTLVASMPFGSSTQIVNHIDRVVCTKTNGNKRLYALSSTGQQYQLAVYDPSETNPSLLRYRLTGGWPGQWSCGNISGGCPQHVVALVKLAHLPICNPTDLVIINNRGALLDAIKAIKAEDSNSPAGAAALWASAINKLNRQLEDDSPEYQFTAADNTWGDGSCFSNQCF